MAPARQTSSIPSTGVREEPKWIGIVNPPVEICYFSIVWSSSNETARDCMQMRDSETSFRGIINKKFG